ncbi:MAG: hypothetical protein JSW46_19490 [Gemmatimonadota bacterium]|nr:MAG: hypothetical protein JSW46_19490 [Gemmatimonadota bacterium]
MEGPAERRRRYGEEEVGLILKRAAELQRQEPAAAAEGGGLSLAELEEIAAEAGIDPRHLRRAAEEIDTAAMPLHGEGIDRLAGAPLTLEFERTLSGELQESGFEMLLPEIQDAAEGYGQPSLMSRTLTWQSRSPNSERTLQVTVSSRNGRTRIRIEERYSQLAGQLFGGIVGGVGGGVGLGVGLGVGIGALQSALFAVVWPVGVISGSFLLARTFYRSAVRRRQRVLRDLLDRLTETVEAIVANQTLTSGERRPELPGSRT